MIGREATILDHRRRPVATQDKIGWDSHARPLVLFCFVSDAENCGRASFAVVTPWRVATMFVVPVDRYRGVAAEGCGILRDMACVEVV